MQPPGNMAQAPAPMQPQHGQYAQQPLYPGPQQQQQQQQPHVLSHLPPALQQQVNPQHMSPSMHQQLMQIRQQQMQYQQQQQQQQQKQMQAQHAQVCLTRLRFTQTPTGPAPSPHFATSLSSLQASKPSQMVFELLLQSAICLIYICSEIAQHVATAGPKAGPVMWKILSVFSRYTEPRHLR